MKIFFKVAIFFFLTVRLCAQDKVSPSNRIAAAPEEVFKMFREAGMNPTNHVLTALESAAVEKAFANLPPLHQRILKGHLHSISFLDNMSNSALTSQVVSPDSTKQFNITFRAGILNETTSEWATWKENTCYDRSAHPEYEVHIEAGVLSAIEYVLLHEATHVVDIVININPRPVGKVPFGEDAPFTADVWFTSRVPVSIYVDSLLEKTRFRSGKAVSIELTPQIYKRLGKTPFVSLYAMAAWYEDIAELATIYHLTHKMNQPFYVSVKKNNQEVARFEPMKNKLVKQRIKQLELFYSNRLATNR